MALRAFQVAGPPAPTGELPRKAEVLRLRGCFEVMGAGGEGGGGNPNTPLKRPYLGIIWAPSPPPPSPPSPHDKGTPTGSGPFRGPEKERPRFEKKLRRSTKHH